MVSSKVESSAKVKRDLAKKAVALAMKGRWPDAVVINQAILHDFPDDLVAYNRSGKALTETGRYEEAKAAFRRALELSPHNAIANKNLDRLMQLGDAAPRNKTKTAKAPLAFIAESGKAVVTSLINLAPPKLLLAMAPGDQVDLDISVGGTKVAGPSEEYIGQIEPKLATRLARLVKDGNRYDAAVTSVGERELTVIVREVYEHPSQARVVSFPSKSAGGYRQAMSGSVPGFDASDDETERIRSLVVKDWSDDDTEPGDDDDFSPVIHRIINPSEDDDDDN